MTPERLQAICDEAWDGIRVGGHFMPEDVLELLNYIDLLHEDLRITRAERDAEKHKNLVVKQELHLYKTQMREARAIAWDTGAQAGLDWDKNYPGNIRDSNPFKDTK